mmetsp:Transcript_105594/g.305211  ORF Transcript_105594/g.305211 Transcript_105594/m.305211 type:complete len:299 (+) Transcript_105594:283-1179(+)
MRILITTLSSQFVFQQNAFRTTKFRARGAAVHGTPAPGRLRLDREALSMVARVARSLVFHLGRLVAVQATAATAAAAAAELNPPLIAPLPHLRVGEVRLTRSIDQLGKDVGSARGAQVVEQVLAPRCWGVGVRRRGRGRGRGRGARFEQRERRTELCHPPGVKHQHLVVKYDSLQPMRDAKHRAALVRAQVNAGAGCAIVFIAVVMVVAVAVTVTAPVRVPIPVHARAVLASGGCSRVATDGCLDERVCVGVDGCGRLVHNHHARPSQQRARHAKQLKVKGLGWDGVGRGETGRAERA